MNTINLESIGFKEMTTQETLMVEGGHDGTAYQIGKALHSVITRLADVATSIIGALLQFFSFTQMIISSGYHLFAMFEYLKNPKFEIDHESTILKKVSLLLKLYFTTFFFTFLSVALISIIDSCIVNLLHQNSIWSEIRNSNSKVKNMFGQYSYIIIAILIPFIEEVIFRLPMNLKKSSIAISIAILYLRFSGNFITNFIDIRKTEDIFKILIAIIIFTTLMIVLSQKKLDIIKRKHYRIVFYFIAICFGLIHITNFHPINYYLFFLYPFYVLPQFFMGVFIGHFRIRYGFIWGWALHALINSTSFLLP